MEWLAPARRHQQRTSPPPCSPPRQKGKRARARTPDNKQHPSWTNSKLPDKRKIRYLHDVSASHVDSFNFALGPGLQYAVNDLLPKKVAFEDGRVLHIWLENVRVQKPCRDSVSSRAGTSSLEYPSACRESHSHYGGKMTATVCVQPGYSGQVHRLEKNLGLVPIMVRSQLCNLGNASPEEMVRFHEDATEFGGYFICNGNERVVRHLQIPRRNHILAMTRPSYQKRGPMYTNQAVSLRSVGPDQSGQTITLHYLRDGTVTARIGIRKAEYFIPVMLLLKALKGPMTSDKEIYTAVLRGAHLEGDTFLTDRVELCLRQLVQLRLFTARQCREYLGSQFRNVLDVENVSGPNQTSNEEAGQVLLRQFVLPHLNEWSCDIAAGANAADKLRATMRPDAMERVGQEKYNLLVEMLRKLFSFVSGKSGADNADALNSHEILTGGHLYLALLKERLDQFLLGVKAGMRRSFAVAKTEAVRQAVSAGDPKAVRKVLEQQAEVGKKLFYFLSTGNVVSPTGLDLMQTAGFTVVAEKLNRYRYLSHFRSVHRGQFFTTMKTTSVRKLLPESWGFLCPVHTPDGTPCGLLNHMAAQCAVLAHQAPTGALSAFSEADVARKPQKDGNSGSRKSLKSGAASAVASLSPTLVRSDAAGSLVPPLAQLMKKLTDWGVIPAGGGRSFSIVPAHKLAPVLIDGRLVGHAPLDLLAKTIVPRLRRAKVASLRVDAAELTRRGVQHFETALKLNELSTDAYAHYSATLEVCLVNPEERRGGAYPGLFLFTGAARLLRPVVHLETGLVELIGNMEQTYLEIAVRPEEVRLGVDTHCEIWPTAMLSVIASLTPFSDFNQSPRNMYQCQMGKQTMGTPAHNLRFRTDNKLYRIQTPQAPIVQTNTQDVFSMDEYPNGTNAVVAVISYTGYDMEDAMILNKGSYERGFAHASIYKTKIVDLTASEDGFQLGNVYLVGEKEGLKVVPSLGLDGLPEVGTKVREGTPLWCCVHPETSQSKVEKHKDSEPAVVDQVRVIGTGSDGSVRKASITLRFNRNPVVGDKFSSRHGQKGVLSVAWPSEDMPFSESGIVPDVIINPHAFPSRMTIGMLIESMAGKAGAMHGCFEDCTPFSMQSDERGKTAVDFFGQQLARAGYNYHGSEPLYSGILGTELQADIYIGVVYYQRLRHLVKDKAQCRMLGPIDQITRQPVKGRKRMGGVRFGEMERDSLIAHGTSFLMRDRLLNCSDKHTAFVCCGSILGVFNNERNARVGPRPGNGSVDAGANTEDIEDGGASDSLDEDQMASVPTSVSKRARLTCKLCGRSDQWHVITIPYVLRFLLNEMAAMGIKMRIG